MLTIRFLRQGKKHQPFFKIVVVEKQRSPKSGKFIEEVGFYNPLTKERKINKERVLYWTGVGAEISDSVYNLLIKDGVLSGKKRPTHSMKKKKEESKGEVKEEQTQESGAKAVEGEEKTKTEEKAEEKAEEVSENVTPGEGEQQKDKEEDKNSESKEEKSTPETKKEEK